MVILRASSVSKRQVSQTTVTSCNILRTDIAKEHYQKLKYKKCEIRTKWQLGIYTTGWTVHAMYFCMSKHSLQLSARESTHQMHVLYNFLLFCPLHYFGLAAKEPEINILHNAEEIITETISGEGRGLQSSYTTHTSLSRKAILLYPVHAIYYS